MFRTAKGKHYFLTWNKPMKYKVLKRLAPTHRNCEFYPWMKCLTIGNEWGVDFIGHGHCHAVLTTLDPTKIEDVKKILKEDYRLKPNDIQSCKNLKKAINYVSKEDVKCISTGHDKDFLSIQCKAYIAAERGGALLPSTYPYCNLIPWQKRAFEEQYNFYRQELEREKDNFWEDNDLRPWQKEALLVLQEQNDRQILWIYDDGNTGKSTLGRYIVKFKNGFMTDETTKKDIAYAYKGEPFVVFNLERECEGLMQFKIFALLKDGVIFSGKYDSRMKTFNSPKIVIFANFHPAQDKLSADRWNIFQVRDGNMRRPIII